MRAPVATARRAAPYVVVAVLMIVLAVVTVGPADGLALDPASTAPDGTAALVAVLEALGSDVALADAPQDLTAGGTVLVLRDPADPSWTAAVDEVLAGGGRVVVTDPASPLGPDAAERFVAPAAEPQCGLAALTTVGRVTGLGFTGYEVPDGAVGCFPIDDDLAWLVVQTRGGGTLVAAAGAGFLTNAALDDADNALLAVQLLRGGPGTQVTVVGPGVAVLAAAGDEGLVDLLPDRVRAALLQLVFALVVVVVWRWRRLGAPVDEPLPVELASSELVVAAGELLDQAAAHGEAVDLLAAALHRDLARRVGLPPAAPPERVAGTAAGLVGVDSGTLLGLLEPHEHGLRPTDGDALVRYAQQVARVRDRAGIGAGAGRSSDPHHREDDQREPDRPSPDDPAPDRRTPTGSAA